MTGFDDRARRAREDLESAFDDLRAPDFAVLQARQRRRRVAAGGVATVLVLALGIVAVGTADRDDPERVATVEPTTTPTVAQPTVPPTANSVTPSTTTTPTTVAQPTDNILEIWEGRGKTNVLGRSTAP